MRAPVLHFGNPTVGIDRAFPLFIGNLLVLAAAIQPPQVNLGRTLYAFGFGQSLQVLFPVFPAVLAHDALHRRIGLQGGRVNRHRLAAQQSFGFQHAQHKDKHFVVHRLGQAFADHRHRDMHRRFLRHRKAQKSPQGQTVGTAPGNAALTVQALEVANQQHPEIDSWRNAGPATFLVIGGAELFDELIKTGGGQNLIEFRVEGMARAGGDVRGGDEEFDLLGFAFTKSHAISDHFPFCQVTKFSDFFNGLLKPRCGLHVWCCGESTGHPAQGRRRASRVNGVFDECLP